MGTRGIVGFHVNGEDKLMYNHFDSYPECLGKDTLNSLQTMLEDRITFAKKVADLKAVQKDILPTVEQIEQLKQWADTSVSTGKLTEWYVLLRKTQGDLAKILDAGYFVPSNEFILDSLMCEFGYIINLDNNTLEFYKGFNSDENADTGRYKTNEPYKASSGDVYFPCKICAIFSFDRVCNDKENVLAEMETLAKGEDADEEAA